MYKIWLLCILLPLLSLKVSGQKSYRAGTLPQINVNFGVAKNFKLNTKLESRQIFSEQKADERRSNQLRYERTDLALVLTRKLSATNTIGGGYLIRLEDGKLAHRLIQQFNYVRNLEMITVAHRFVTDETFRKSEPASYRLRYRLGMEKALNGRQIDPKEMYLKFNNEYLGIWADRSADLEIRGLLSLGYNATDDHKFELGVEYRVNEFNQPVKAQQFWVTVGVFLSI